MSLRPLPTNLAALRTFLEAAKTQSFTEAARAIHVTQGAVSRQMRALEGELGVALFRRTARSVALTPAGRAYYAEVERAFEILERATASARLAERLIVSALPSFSSLWLMPRLPRFEARHPEVRIELRLGYELVDVQRGEADVALRYGRGTYPGTVTKRLFDETLVPLAAPSLARRLRGDRMWSAPLLSAGGEDETRGDLDWDAWSEATGRRLPPGARYRRLRDYQRVLHAARAGLGVAMGRLALVEPLVASGALVPLTKERAVGVTRHSFVCSTESWQAPPVQMLFRWLRAQARAPRA